MGIRAIILSLFFLLPTTGLQADSPDLSGENPFGRYECIYKGKNLNCVAQTEYSHSDPILEEYISESLNITLGRAYTIAMIAAITSTQSARNQRNVNMITISFKDGWKYKIPYVKALGCVSLFSTKNDQTRCILRFVDGGLFI